MPAGICSTRANPLSFRRPSRWFPSGRANENRSFGTGWPISSTSAISIQVSALGSSLPVARAGDWDAQSPLRAAAREQANARRASPQVVSLARAAQQRGRLVHAGEDIVVAQGAETVVSADLNGDGAHAGQDPLHLEICRSAGSGKRMGVKRKSHNLDETLLRRAKRVLGASTETQAIHDALRAVLISADMVADLDAARGNDVFRPSSWDRCDRNGCGRGELPVRCEHLLRGHSRPTVPGATSRRSAPYRAPDLPEQHRSGGAPTGREW